VATLIEVATGSRLEPNIDGRNWDSTSPKTSSTEYPRTRFKVVSQFVFKSYLGEPGGAVIPSSHLAALAARCSPGKSRSRLPGSPKLRSTGEPSRRRKAAVHRVRFQHQRRTTFGDPQGIASRPEFAIPCRLHNPSIERTVERDCQPDLQRCTIQPCVLVPPCTAFETPLLKSRSKNPIRAISPSAVSRRSLVPVRLSVQLPVSPSLVTQRPQPPGFQ